MYYYFFLLFLWVLLCEKLPEKRNNIILIKIMTLLWVKKKKTTKHTPPKKSPKTFWTSECQKSRIFCLWIPWFPGSVKTLWSSFSCSGHNSPVARFHFEESVCLLVCLFYQKWIQMYNYPTMNQSLEHESMVGIQVLVCHSWMVHQNSPFVY